MAARSFSRFRLPRPLKKRPEDHGYLIKDPAIERWGKMRETTYLHFKFTPKTVFLAVVWGAIVPGSFYYLLKQDLRRQDIKAGRTPREFP